MQKTIQFEEPPEKSLRDIYYIIFRHKWKAIWFFIGAIIIVNLISFFSPRIYRSEAELLIKIGRESGPALESAVAPNQFVDVTAQRENELNSEISILKNRELMEKVVDSIGVEAILKGYDKETGGQGLGQKILGIPRKLIALPFEGVAKLLSFFDSEEVKKLKQREKAIQNLYKNFKTEIIKKSNSIKVSYDAKSPGLAQKVLSKIIDSYLDKHIQVHRTEGSYQFFNDQKNRLYQTILQTSKELSELKNKAQVGSLEEQRSILMKRIGFLKRELESTEAEIAVSEAMVNTMEQEIANLPPAIVKQEVSGGALSAPDEMLKRVNELELKEQELRATFTEDSIPVLEAKRQVEEAKRILKKTEETRQITRGINETRQRLELNLLTEKSVLASLKSKSEALKEQLTKAQEELNLLNDIEQRITQLELDKKIQETNYQKYYEGLEQSLIDQALELVKISNVRIVQSPTYPMKYARPRLLLNCILGILLGIFGGLGLAFISESLNHSFGKPEDIERTLEIPALGAITSLVPKQSACKGKPDQWLPFKFDPTLPFIKDFEAVGERLIMWAKRQPSSYQVFSLTGCHKGAGVSTVAAYLASSLVHHSEGRVLLVDANFSHPTIHQIFNLNHSPGLADLVGSSYIQTSVIQPSGIARLDVLSAGKANIAQGQKVFESTIFTDLIKFWKHEYHFVLIDTPAVWEESYVVTLGSMVDGMIMVFEAEEDRWEVAQRAKNLLEMGGVKLVGGILNKRIFYVPQWVYQRL